MKHVYISALILSISLLAGCGGSSSSSSSSTRPAASITITATNADSVAKGAMSSKDTASTGTDSASVIKTSTLIADPAKKFSALSLAMEHLKKAESLRLPSATAARAVTGWPLKIDCATGIEASVGQTTNMITYGIVDADNSTTLNTGDTFSVTYASCTLPTTTITIDGDTFLTLNSYTPPTTLNGPSSGSITVGYNSFTITDSATAVTAGLDGSMTLGFSFDGTTFTASMSGASFTASHSEVGSVTYTNFAFTSTANATVETFAADLSISMTPTGGTTGTVNISTPVTFSGPIGGNPTSGQMRIDGANGSYITITAKSDGTGVDIVIFDGTNTTLTTRTWDQL